MQNKQHKQTIGILIPTRNAINHLKACLIPLIHCALNPRILIIDSSSEDGTVDFARKLGVEVCIIPQKEFNHGSTREWGRKKLATDIVVMMTQDAYPGDQEMLDKLVTPIFSGQASVAYARQIPHDGAGFLAKFARNFNYPSNSHVRSLNDVHLYGIYTFFCSNSCAAYRNSALDEIGGFPHACFGEDTIAVAKLLHRNHSIAYVAEAIVRHSHDYTLKEEFFRHIDIGRSRESFRDLIQSGGKDSKRGSEYTLALFNELWNKYPSLIPYAALQTLAKYAGYQTGKIYARFAR